MRLRAAATRLAARAASPAAASGNVDVPLAAPPVPRESATSPTLDEGAAAAATAADLSLGAIALLATSVVCVCVSARGIEEGRPS